MCLARCLQNRYFVNTCTLLPIYTSENKIFSYRFTSEEKYSILRELRKALEESCLP